MATSRSRFRPSISTSSMADIAFLLLIFFLVVTRIEVEQGIPLKLPPWDPAAVPVKVPERDVLRIQLNAAGEVMVEDEVMAIGEVRATTKLFIDNNGQRADYSRSPQHAVIDLALDRDAHYGDFIGVYNEIRAAYRELREAWMEQQLQLNPNIADSTILRRVKEMYPIHISERELTDAPFPE